MRDQLPALIVLIPMAVATLMPLIAFLSVRILPYVAVGTLIASFICAVSVLNRVLSHGAFSYWFGGWEPPWGVEYVIDPLSAGLAVLITFFAALIAVYYGPFLREDAGAFRKGLVYALFLLMTAGLVGIVFSGDLFTLFVFIEISSLATYALVASGGPKAAVASFNYILIGTVGVSFYLLGLGYLYALTGTLNMADLAVLLQSLEDSQTVMIALLLIIVGISLKMALFPMHGWLPDVHTYAPPPLKAFLAGVKLKIFAYILLRLFFFTFGAEYGEVPTILNALGLTASIGIIVTAAIAIRQEDFRRVLAYSTISQIGYVVLGLAIGNAVAMKGALLHIVNHAFMKCCLFFIAGSVTWKTGEYSIDMYAGLSKKMPLSMTAFLISAISMIGLPPTAGFFSKWYLVQGAIMEGAWHYVVVIAFGSLLSAIYFFKTIEQVWLKKTDQVKPPGLELPLALLVPIMITGVGVLVLGIFNEPIVTHVLQAMLPGRGF
ncbi:MAG: hypothetical protein FWD00_05280 [Clostridiales bacterium]|nr:hypothetical protein [Clostridiales bacterium]